MATIRPCLGGAWVMPQGYVEAARIFEGESGTSPSVDLDTITDRMQIRQAVQGGNVEQAVERVNDLNPEASASACMQAQVHAGSLAGCMSRPSSRFGTGPTIIMLARSLLPDGPTALTAYHGSGQASSGLGSMPRAGVERSCRCLQETLCCACMHGGQASACLPLLRA